MANDEDPIVEVGTGLVVRGLGHAFGDLEVLSDIDLDLGAGETVAIVGPSGCGKSTLLELIGGLATADGTRGEIAVGDATGPEERLARCTYMPQRDLLLPWLRALDNAALGPSLAGTGRGAAREQALPLFKRLGLGGFEGAWPHELSGGMRQRVAFARTLLNGKPVLLLDEPLAALDIITRADLQSWLRLALAAEPRTTLLVTHDVEEALYVADRVVVLSGRPGRIVHAAAAPLSEPGDDRAGVVTDPAFTAARERALHELGEGAG